MQLIPAVIGILILGFGVLLLVRGEPIFEFFFRRREDVFGKGALGGRKVSVRIQRVVAFMWMIMGAICLVAAFVGPPFDPPH
jgi:hypothetical protein